MVSFTRVSASQAKPEAALGSLTGHWVEEKKRQTLPTLHECHDLITYVQVNVRRFHLTQNKVNTW